MKRGQSLCHNLDGRSKSVSGTAAADASYQYTVGTDLDDIPGAVMKTTLTRPSGTDAGNLVTDAQIAAITMGYDAVLHTADADFMRFPNLRWRNPILGTSSVSHRRRRS